MDAIDKKLSIVNKVIFLILIVLTLVSYTNLNVQKERVAKAKEALRKLQPNMVGIVYAARDISATNVVTGEDLTYDKIDAKTRPSFAIRSGTVAIKRKICCSKRKGDCMFLSDFGLPTVAVRRMPGEAP